MVVLRLCIAMTDLIPNGRQTTADATPVPQLTCRRKESPA
jgi:hypothetical protein